MYDKHIRDNYENEDGSEIISGLFYYSFPAYPCCCHTLVAVRCLRRTGTVTATGSWGITRIGLSVTNGL